ncbi:phage protein [Kluyvera georgiana ATCC 51603]|uniref:Phage protein n=1 Tax=Kluyvera georgiana ATCC 51603 TaxID=1354264 RepID=A0A1B7JZE7_9ENTR|nr:hypothetical protein [Kluyvera georgiana]OAT53260.1 phage protein [Kluyvera georgiana ATCC 51603]
MSNDITALMATMKAAAERAKHAGAAQIMPFDTRISALNEFQLAACPANVLALVEALEKAQQSANINNQWKPDVCPITRRKFFMWIEHPDLGYVPTYGGPFDSYTIPSGDSDGEFSCERYDHDVGGWVDGECVGSYLIDEDEQCRVYELEQRVTELREQLRTVELSNSVLESRTVTVKLPNSFYPDGDIELPLVMNEYQVIEALVAAGCKPVAVCPRCKRELDLSVKHDGAHYCHRAAGIQVIEGEQKNG